MPITNESKEHFLKKCEVAYDHYKSCGHILSEVRDKKTGRTPDVSCISCGEIEIEKTSLSDKAIGKVVKI